MKLKTQTTLLVSALVLLIVVMAALQTYLLQRYARTSPAISVEKLEQLQKKAKPSQPDVYL